MARNNDRTALRRQAAEVDGMTPAQIAEHQKIMRNVKLWRRERRERSERVEVKDTRWTGVSLKDALNRAHINDYVS